MKTKSQEKKILTHLKSGRRITPLQALSLFDCLRLGARIHRLRKQGYNITTESILTRTGKRVAGYRLES